MLCSMGANARVVRLTSIGGAWVSMTRYYRKVIRIRAEDSPNVRLALAQKERGEEITGEVLVPGVLTWDEYQKRRLLWNTMQQAVSLDAEFYKGGEVWLFTQEVLQHSVELALKIRGNRIALSMGIDAAEGGDSTVWTVTDLKGIIHQLSIKTRDTSDIPSITLGLMREYKLSPNQVLFDRGGGGKQHADQLRSRGYDVRTVGFGEAASDPHRDRKRSTVKPQVKERVTRSESQYAYKNRRAEMYGITADLFNSEQGFAVSHKYTETLRQLKAIPKLYDSEGRMFLPPKNNPNKKSNEVTLNSILGRSPDEADSLVLAVFGMLRKPPRIRVGAV
jgi:hypothetical protein